MLQALGLACANIANEIKDRVGLMASGGREGLLPDFFQRRSSLLRRSKGAEGQTTATADTHAGVQTGDGYP